MRDNPTVVLSGIYHAMEDDAYEYHGWFVTYTTSWAPEYNRFLPISPRHSQNHCILWVSVFLLSFEDFLCDPITNANRTGIMQQKGLNITGSSPFEVPKFAIVVVSTKA